MLKKTYPCYLANRPQQPNADLAVLDKYSGKVATRVAVPDAKAVEKAIAVAVNATTPMRQFKPGHARPCCSIARRVSPSAATSWPKRCASKRAQTDQGCRRRQDPLRRPARRQHARGQP